MYAGIWIRQTFPGKGPFDGFLEILDEDIKSTDMLGIIVFWVQSAVFIGVYGVLGSIVNDETA